jgi:hypothetical protein
MLGEEYLRNYLFVDPKVQVSLMIRVACYWCVCFLGVAFVLFGWQSISVLDGTFVERITAVLHNDGPVLFALLMLLPLLVIDVVRLSNRFVGPMLRLRRSIRELARGDDVPPLEFREGDFWPEIADEFNALRARTLAATCPESSVAPQSRRS